MIGECCSVGAIQDAVVILVLLFQYSCKVLHLSTLADTKM